MPIEFTKMHGLGNDFVLIDGVRQTPRLSADAIRHLGDRRRGIGFDQLLVARKARSARSELGVDIYNADGSPAGQCGNGMRCFVVFAHDRRLVGGEVMRVGIGPGEDPIVTGELRAGGEVRIDMGAARFEPADIPFLAAARAGWYPLDIAGARYRIGAVSMGNPHAVIEVGDLRSTPVEVIGPAIQGSERFPHGVNVGFMQVLAPDRIALRVFERGVGETLACGSGACAAVAWGVETGRIEAPARAGQPSAVGVELPGGVLTVEVNRASGAVHLIGPTARVFDGVVDL